MRLNSTSATFLMFSGAIYADIDRAALQSFYNKVGMDLTSRTSRVSRWRINPSAFAYNNVNPKELDLFLLDIHERDHFEQFVGSPLGLLIYRSYLTLTATMGWLFQEFFIPGGLSNEPSAGRPFVEWIASDACNWIAERLRSGRIPMNPAWAKSMQNIESYVCEIAIPELVTVSEFLKVILDRENSMTLRQFADLANRASEHICMRCDVPLGPPWDTRYPDYLLHPEGDSILSTSELFELCALAKESKVLQSCGAPSRAISAWANAYNFGVYKKGLELVSKSGLEITILGTLARHALLTPCDQVLRPDGVMYVEDLHPTWRFKNLYFFIGDARECPRTGMSHQQRFSIFSSSASQGGVQQAIESMSRHAMTGPLPLVKDVLSGKMEVPFVGRGSNFFADDEDKKNPYSPGSAIEDMLSIFKEGIGSSVEGGDARNVRERIKYFNDTAALPSLGSGKLAVLIATHCGTLNGYLYLSHLLEGIDASSIPSWDTSFIARLREDAPSADIAPLEQLCSPRFNARVIFGEAYATSLGFA